MLALSLSSISLVFVSCVPFSLPFLLSQTRHVPSLCCSRRRRASSIDRLSSFNIPRLHTLLLLCILVAFFRHQLGFLSFIITLRGTWNSVTTEFYLRWISDFLLPSVFSLDVRLGRWLNGRLIERWRRHLSIQTLPFPFFFYSCLHANNNNNSSFSMILAFGFFHNCHLSRSIIKNSEDVGGEFGRLFECSSIPDEMGTMTT